MKFDSLPFLLFIIGSLASFHLFRRSVIIPFVLALINAVFLLSYSSSLEALIPLTVFILLGYVFICYLYHQPNRRALAVFITIIIFLFIYLKRYTVINFIPSLTFPYTVMGLSYILFRVLQVMIDVYDRNIPKKISLLDYFNFVWFFPTFVSGPIQRYQDFHLQQQRLPAAELSREDVFRAFSRIMNGYIKIVFLAPFFSNTFSSQYLEFNYVFDKLHGHGLVILSCWYAFALFWFLFKLYMNFSGYMDIVIGLGKLFYFDLPENFNQPFTSKNFLDFWGRWHITLAGWFKFYLFNPISKAIMYRLDSLAAVPYVGVVAYFITFFIMGIWHGSTLIFVVYGLFLGLGVGINKLYQVLMRNYLGKKPYSQLAENTYYQYLSRGAAISYFAVALTCLWMSIEQFLSLFGHWALGVMLLAFLILSILYAFIAFLGDLIKRKVEFFFKGINHVAGFFIVRQFWLSVKLFFLVYLFLNNINPAPPFIYQAY